MDGSWCLRLTEAKAHQMAKDRALPATGGDPWERKPKGLTLTQWWPQFLGFSSPARLAHFSHQRLMGFFFFLQDDYKKLTSWDSTCCLLQRPRSLRGWRQERSLHKLFPSKLPTVHARRTEVWGGAPSPLTSVPAGDLSHAVLTAASTCPGGLGRKEPRSDSDQRPKWVHTLKL